MFCCTFLVCFLFFGGVLFLGFLWYFAILFQVPSRVFLVLRFFVDVFLLCLTMACHLWMSTWLWLISKQYLIFWDRDDLQLSISKNKKQKHVIFTRHPRRHTHCVRMWHCSSKRLRLQSGKGFREAKKTSGAGCARWVGERRTREGGSFKGKTGSMFEC